MSKTSILTKNFQKILSWIYDIGILYACEEVDIDQRRALSILRAVLHAIRDFIPAENLAHFSAQLPIFIRGLLFEGWDPHEESLNNNKTEDFIWHIAVELHQYPEIDPEEAARIVFDVLRRKIDKHEVEKLLRVFPISLRKLISNANSS